MSERADYSREDAKARSPDFRARSQSLIGNALGFRISDSQNTDRKERVKHEKAPLPERVRATLSRAIPATHAARIGDSQTIAFPIGRLGTSACPRRRYYFRNSAICALLILLLTPIFAIAASPEFWPQPVKGSDAELMRQWTSKIDSAMAGLPGELKPAAQFQKTFLRILSGAKESTWRGDLNGYLKVDAANAGNPAKFMSHAIAELSKTWITRLEMQEIDKQLRNYYRKQVQFPEKLAVIEPSIPEALRRDPWGEPWAYKPRAPEGFSKLATQRYDLGPARMPKLATLAQAIGDRNTTLPQWKITPQELGGNKALEFRSGASVVTLQPGGKVDGFTLLYIDDGWALVAGSDQLLAVTF